MSKSVQITIQPDTINQLHHDNNEAAMALYSLLTEDNANNLWSSHQYYKFSYLETNYQFSFTQSILKRKRKEGKEGDRFEIFNSNQHPLGKGGFGIVYPIIGTMKFIAGKPLIQTKKKRVVKIEDHSKKNKVNSIIDEYNGLLKSGHLHPKPPVFIGIDAKIKSYLVMYEAGGVPLEKIMSPTKRRELIDLIPELTVAKRIDLTLAILRAIKTQVSDVNLIHRDLKPWNLIIDLKQSPPEVIVVDYGLVLEQGKQDFRKVGTKAYRATESFSGSPIYTLKSDVYSTGRILSYLWGDNYQNYYIKRDKDFNFIKSKSTNKELFNLPEIKFVLSLADQKKIKYYLDSMLNPNPDKRPSLDELLYQFSGIDSQFYNNTIEQDFKVPEPQQFETLKTRHLAFMKTQLMLLSHKEMHLLKRGCHDAAHVMNKLLLELQINTRLLEQTSNPSLLKGYKNCCMAEISKAKETLQYHRDSWWLVAEITIAISLLGIGYLISLGVNYLITNKFGFFSQTKSMQLVEEIKDSLEHFGHE